MDDFDNSTASAIFQYRGNYSTIPPSTTPIFPAFVPDYADIETARRFTTQLRGLGSEEHPVDVPLEVDTRMFITLSSNMPEFLLRRCRNTSGIYETDFPDYPDSFFNFTSDDLNTANYGRHPMHLHGFRAFLIGSGYGVFDNETSPLAYNLIDPPEGNTISVPKNGWATIRFRANNPGVWFMHCHYERHMSWGMNTAFIVKHGGTAETSIRGPPANMPPCKYSPLLHQMFNYIESDIVSNAA